MNIQDARSRIVQQNFNVTKVSSSSSMMFFVEAGGSEPKHLQSLYACKLQKNYLALGCPIAPGHNWLWQACEREVALVRAATLSTMIMWIACMLHTHLAVHTEDVAIYIYIYIYIYISLLRISLDSLRPPTWLKFGPSCCNFPWSKSKTEVPSQTWPPFKAKVYLVAICIHHASMCIHMYPCSSNMHPHVVFDTCVVSEATNKYKLTKPQ